MSRSLAAASQLFPLIRPFRISRGEKIAAEVVTVTIRDGDHAGSGEAVPYARYGETIPRALEQIEEVRPLIERGGSRTELLDALPAGAARNALDCALWDLEAKLSGRPVAASIGGPALRPIASAMTIVIDTPEKMAREAAALAGYPLLKVKVDSRDPEAQIRAVRAAAPTPRLIVDPNESWDRALMEEMRALLAEARVDLLEQPVPADDDDWLEGFEPSVPICADESVHVAEDLPRVARLYGCVNVKLDKSGGLTAALELAHAARAQGLGLMTGCMICSSLSIAPAFHVAMMAAHVDMDGPIWLKEDRAGGVRMAEGYLHPPEPGFWGE